MDQVIHAANVDSSRLGDGDGDGDGSEIGYSLVHVYYHRLLCQGMNYYVRHDDQGAKEQQFPKRNEVSLWGRLGPDVTKKRSLLFQS